MHKFQFPMKFIERFSGFRLSKEYREVPDYAKSENWRYHSEMIAVDVIGNEIIVRGASGYYIPPIKKRIMQLLRLIKQEIQVTKNRSGIRLKSYINAFDSVMNHDPMANIEVAPYRINFQQMKAKSGVISSAKKMKKAFFAKDKYYLNDSMVHAYYLYNIMRGFTDISEIDLVVEIGAGNGNLSALIWHELKPHMIIVDLPETLCLSIPFIADLFPEARILMPHEAELYDPKLWDFIFLTPQQQDLIEDSSISLVINIHSFQEMTHRQIDEYFNLIQRCCKEGAYFLTANRAEKIPSRPDTLQQVATEPVNRFADYPWKQDNEVIIYEISRLMRLVQLDDVYVRLERIRK